MGAPATFLGIEFGSTRIKAVLIDERHRVIAQGAHDWENQFVDGVWSYSMDAVIVGLQDAYAKLKADFEAKGGAKLTQVGALGISGMMHGYLPFDSEWRLLTPFRTWRNVMTAKAAAELSQLFRFNIPQRWSIAHYHQAKLNGEAHVGEVRHLTTLVGHVHRLLSGENVLGVGEASGMFPIDPVTRDYNARMLDAYAQATGEDLRAKLPVVKCAGEVGGRLTMEGAKLLDPTGELQSGALMAPPEGDAGTGMVATNAVAPRTGNVSAGTSIFAMIVLEQAMKGFYPQIDVVTTPSGREVAMVHCNNCTNEINAFREMLGKFSYSELFQESLKGEVDCGGVVVVPYLSGEPVTGVETPMLKIVRRVESRFTLANLMRAQIYSAFVSLKLGMEILSAEGIAVDAITGHGGIFKDRGIAQQYLADALNASVTCLTTASEGGPWGMAVLAAYAASGASEPLEKYLSDRVFAGAQSETLAPTTAGVEGFDRYARNFKEVING